METLRTDLELALQFLLIAQTSHNQETAAGNRRNAREGPRPLYLSLWRK
jgi:hypothetical protein